MLILIKSSLAFFSPNIKFLSAWIPSSPVFIVKLPPFIVKSPSECTASSIVFKLKLPPLIINSILILVSFVDTFIPLALSVSLLNPELEAPFLYVLILKLPSFIINLLLA